MVVPRQPAHANADYGTTPRDTTYDALDSDFLPNLFVSNEMPSDFNLGRTKFFDLLTVPDYDTQSSMFH